MAFRGLLDFTGLPVGVPSAHQDVTATVVEVLVGRASDAQLTAAVVETLTGRAADLHVTAGLVETLVADDIDSTRVHGAVVEALTYVVDLGTKVQGVVVEALIGRLPLPEDVLVPEYPTIAERRFGRDLLLVPDGEVPATATGDWPTLAGRPNLHAAVRRRLLTTPGQLVHRGEYGAGIETYVGELNAPAERARLAADARANLLRDPRLEEARVSVTEPDEDMVEISAQIRPSGEIETDTVSVATET